jgi:hypothetical protein
MEPTNINEADNTAPSTTNPGTPSDPFFQKYSFTVAVAHELGHVLGSTHDNQVFNVKYSSSEGNGNAFKDIFQQCYNTSYDNIKDIIWQEQKPIADKQVLQDAPYYRDNSGNVFKANWRDKWILINGKLIGSGYEWNPVGSIPSDQEQWTFYWHVCIMATYEQDFFKFKNPMKNISYLLFGSLNALNYTTIGYATNHIKDSQSYRTLFLGWGYEPVTDK